MRLRHTITEQRSIVPIKGMAWSRDFQVPQEGAWVAVRSANVRTDFRSTIIFSTPCHVGKDARVTKQLASEQALLFARFARPNSRACSQATLAPSIAMLLFDVQVVHAEEQGHNHLWLRGRLCTSSLPVDVQATVDTIIVARHKIRCCDLQSMQ